MSEETKQTQDSTGAETNTEKTPITEDSSKNVSSNMIPKTRFDEVNNQAKALKEKLEKYESEKQEAEKLRLEEQGKFKEANEQYRTENEALKEKAKYWDSYSTARRDALVKALPENQREFTEDMSLEKLEKFVATNLPKSQEKPKTTFADTPGAFQKNNLPEDWTKMSDDEKKSNWSSILKSKLNKN
tara:strand:- start:1804 stop:2364 length:561 start_codon:yes stop_codon:yes gene_type:complete